MGLTSASSGRWATIATAKSYAADEMCSASDTSSEDSTGSASCCDDLCLMRRAIGRSTWCAATAELKPAEIRRRHAAFVRNAHLVSTEISQLPLATVIALLLFARAHSIPTVLDVDVPPADACPALGTRAELERAPKLATVLQTGQGCGAGAVRRRSRIPLNGRSDSRTIRQPRRCDYRRRTRMCDLRP